MPWLRQKRGHGMSLSDAELVAFQKRCLKASQKGYAVAKAELYVKALASEAGHVAPPLGTKKASAAHLHALAGAVLEARTKGGKKKAPKAKEVAPEPKIVAPPAAVEPPPPPPQVLTEPAPVSEEAPSGDEGSPVAASDESDAGPTKKKKKR